MQGNFEKSGEKSTVFRINQRKCGGESCGFKQISEIAFPVVCLDANTEDMQKARSFIGVAGQRAKKSIVALGGNEIVLSLSPHNDESVVKIALTCAQLNKIAKLRARAHLGKGALARIFGQKAIEEGHTRPRSRAVTVRAIIPAERGLKIHHQCTRKQTLRGEVGAVTAIGRVIVKKRVARKRPTARIGHGALAVIRKR